MNHFIETDHTTAIIRIQSESSSGNEGIERLPLCIRGKTWIKGEIFFGKTAFVSRFTHGAANPFLPSCILRLEQCFRSYPRNYTSVWLSATTPTLRTLARGIKR